MKVFNSKHRETGVRYAPRWDTHLGWYLWSPSAPPHQRNPRSGLRSRAALRSPHLFLFSGIFRVYRNKDTLTRMEGYSSPGSLATSNEGLFTELFFKINTLFLAAPGGMCNLSSPTRNRMNLHPLHWKCGILTIGPATEVPSWTLISLF